MIVRRQSDAAISQITDSAPEEFDTFKEVADMLTLLKNKLDLITVTGSVDLDTIASSSLTGTIDEFEEYLN